MKHHRKTCCHCGRETHPQPQDYDHDTGYGHCYDCLNKKDWYVHISFKADPFYLKVWINRLRVGADLCSDDSDPKVVEVFKGDTLLSHFTSHKTMEQLIGALNAFFGSNFELGGALHETAVY